MVRAMIAGGTKYTHQSFEDIVIDLNNWIDTLNDTLQLFDQNIEKLEETGYWNTVPQRVQWLIGYSSKFYETCIQEIQEILNDFQFEVQENHIIRIQRLCSEAYEFNDKYGEVWNNDWFRDPTKEFEYKDYNNPEFLALEKFYVEGRGMAADLLDLGPLSVRLQDFIGRRGTAARELQPAIENEVITILLLTSDPSDASRLRLGEEMREIQEKLQMATLREKFELHQRTSVRPTDITQAMLDTQPKIVHFSGHGANTGELCFENKIGEVHPVSPEALSALFEQFSEQVECVLLNACHSEIQATAISQHIECVIGMKQEIGDEAAIAFAIGFYQALGAGSSIEIAYNLGCIQIQLHNIPEHLTPILIKKDQM